MLICGEQSRVGRVERGLRLRLAAGLLSALLLPGSVDAAERLFAAVEVAAPQVAPTDLRWPDGATLRHRWVRINAGTLALARDGGAAQAPATLTLNLFDDTAFTGIVNRVARTFSGGYALSGGVIEDPLGSMALVVNGDTVAGTVRTVDGTYRIRSVGGGLYAVAEVDLPDDCGVVDGQEALIHGGAPRGNEDLPLVE